MKKFRVRYTIDGEMNVLHFKDFDSCERWLNQNAANLMKVATRIEVLERFGGEFKRRHMWVRKS